MLFSSILSHAPSIRPQASTASRSPVGRAQVKPQAFFRPQSEPQLIPIPVEEGLGQSAPAPRQQRSRGNGYDMFVARKESEHSAAAAEKEPQRDFENLGSVWQAAYLSKRDQLADLLKTHPGEVNQQDKNGFTPLAVAVRYGNDAVVKILLESGKADLKCATVDGKTPLILAAQYGRLPILKQLLTHRAKLDINAQDNRGKTALAWAQSKFNRESIACLKQAGAQP